MKNALFDDKFVEKITGNMDEILYEFYENKKEENKYFKRSLEDIIEEIIDSTFYSIHAIEDIQNVLSYKKNYKLKKKSRWAQSSLATCVPPYDDPKFPFKDIHNLRVTANAKQWKEKYGKKEFADIVEEKKSEIVNWKNSKITKMIDFPGLNSFGPKVIYSAFEMDLTIDMLEKTAGILNDHTPIELQSYLMEIDQAPYFTNTNSKYFVKDDNKNELFIPMSEDSELLLSVSLDPGFLESSDTFKMMDSKDIEILSSIIDIASSNIGIAKNVNDDVIVVETVQLAKILSGKHNPSKKQYEEAAQRCFRIANSTYNKFSGGKQVAAINFMDSAVVIEAGGRQMMRIKLGEYLMDAVMRNKISRLPADVYKGLGNTTSRLLYFPLQKRRILLWKESNRNEEFAFKSTYTYKDFLTLINFGKTPKSKNFQAVIDALDEYVEQGRVVKNYIVSRRQYSIDIEFYPLSEEEQANLAEYNIQSVSEAEA